jgi:hypothetical protein
MTKNLRTKFTKKYRNKNTGTKVKKIGTKSRNKISKNQEQKLQKSENKK